MDHEITDQWAEVRGVWRRSLKADGKPETTIKAYTLSYDRLATWARHAHVGGPEDIDEGHLDEFFAHRREMPGINGKTSPTTIAIDFRHLRAFYNWAQKRGIVESSPMKGRNAPTVPEEPVPIIEDDELIKLQATCKAREFSDRRDLAIIRLLFDAGIRHDEICRIDVDDLNRDKQEATVTGKGGGVRKVPYGAKTAAAIDDYMLVRTKHPDRALKALWLAASPHRGAFGYDGFRLMIKRRWKRAGLTGRIFLHRFRHTAAHTQALAGMGEGEMMHIFGWKDPSMPKRYGKSAGAERAIKKARELSHADRI